MPSHRLGSTSPWVVRSMNSDIQPVNGLLLTSQLPQRPKGDVSVVGLHTASGEPVSLEEGLSRGWLKGKVEDGEVSLGQNLFVDTGRQALCYAFGEQGPTANFTVQKFGLGIGTVPPRVTDVALADPLSFYGGGELKPIELVAFPAPFIIHVQFTIAASEANGYLITEMGLFTDNGSLLARRTHIGINKSSDFAPTLAWRIRF